MNREKDMASQSQPSADAKSAATDAAPSAVLRPVLDRPAPGTKFVALYDDGSGAVLLYACDLGFIEADGTDWNEDSLADRFDCWLPLPDSIVFNCERWTEDAYTLPTAADLAGGGS